MVRDSCAQVLDIPVSQIRVVPMEIGGGFGGKINVYLEPVAALLSKKTGQAVKIVMSRADVFEGTGPTPGSYVKVKIGAKNDGTITAAHAYIAFEAGAYPGSPVGAAGMCVFSAYDIDNVVIDGYDVVVNKPKTAAYRAPGAPNAAFAAEQVVDELANKLGMDPIDFRLHERGQRGHPPRRWTGLPSHRLRRGPGGYEEPSPLQCSARRPQPRARGQYRLLVQHRASNRAAASRVNDDGTINLVEGSTDIGGTRASIAMQAAEVLGIAAEDVRPTVADTDSVGYTAVTGGSRTTFATGWAAYEAAQDVKRQMIERAATVWEVDADSVEFDKGAFKSKTDPELSMSFKDLAGQLSSTGGPIVGRAAVNPQGARAAPSRGTSST